MINEFVFFVILKVVMGIEPIFLNLQSKTFTKYATRPFLFRTPATIMRYNVFMLKPD